MWLIGKLVCVCAIVIVAMAVPANAAEKKGTEIDGTWKLIEYFENGKPLNDIVKQNYLIVRKNGLQTITRDGKPFSKVKFKIDPSQSPSHINFINDQGCLEIGRASCRERV